MIPTTSTQPALDMFPLPPSYSQVQRNKQQYELSLPPPSAPPPPPRHSPPLSRPLLSPSQPQPTPPQPLSPQPLPNDTLNGQEPSPIQSEDTNGSQSKTTDDEEVRLLKRLERLHNNKEYMLTLNPGHPQLPQVTKTIMAIQTRLGEIEKEKFEENKREVERIIEEKARQEAELERIRLEKQHEQVRQLRSNRQYNRKREAMWEEQVDPNQTARNHTQNIALIKQEKQRQRDREAQREQRCNEEFEAWKLELRDSYFDQGCKTLPQPPDDLNRVQQTEADAMFACTLQEQEKAKLLERSRKLEHDREKQE